MDEDLTASPFSEEHSPFDKERVASPEPQTPTAPDLPKTPHEGHLSIASMSSIPLSETDLDYDSLSPEEVEQCLSTPRMSGIKHKRKPSSIEILQNPWAPNRQSTLFDVSQDTAPETHSPDSDYEDDGAEEEEDEVDTGDDIPRRSVAFSFAETASAGSRYSAASLTLMDGPRDETVEDSLTPTPKRRSLSSEEVENEVDWQKLEKTEQQEKTDKDLPEGAVDESTTFLLARLEQENALLTNDPKAVNKTVKRLRTKSRPPSMAQLKKLVSRGDADPSNRYSLTSDLSLPDEPPPMTELEFWAALVQDYPSTAARLPTLTTSKIRAGIPPPLRGVVWTSMSGARDKGLEEAFQRLQNEQSPYEGIINKDVGRSFPGVELFRDADGEGQKMLGRVLKCFSLQDKDIGYCQGLGFLVGPLLMNMGEQESFCVLVRLMDHYALRPSFLPSLSGLHMRIYQFSALLKQLHPQLYEHLSGMGVEPAYLSQWFLSCFAVTCPLAMLFRIYDVIFAEGANETVMRVALALMRRNEQKMMESTEFEEVMQLLLGRSIWDSYGCNADDLVDDFTSLGNVITNAKLAELEKEFDTKSRDAVGEKAGFLPDVQAAAGRFLGRLWAPSHAASKSSSTLSPPSGDKEAKGNALRRSPSKQSISTLNDGSSNESTSSGSASLASTAPTESDADTLRESTTDLISLRSKSASMHTLSVAVPTLQAPHMSKEDKDLHTQIEDLLTALSEMQREHAELVAMLQREREERGEDQLAMKQLVGRLKPNAEKASNEEDRRRTMPPPPRDPPQTKERPLSQPPQSRDDLSSLLANVSERLNTNKRYSASFETKAQLKSTLSRTREQLEREETRARELTARVDDAEATVLAYSAESEDLRSEVEELRRRVNEEFKERQKLEHTVGDLQAQARTMERKERLARAESMTEVPTFSRSETSPGPLTRKGSISSAPPASTAGLRELKLGRRDSTSSAQSARSSRSQRVQPEVVQQQQTAPTTPVSTISPTSAPSRSLTVPNTGGFAHRTSSLATQAVLATHEHEPAPEEALLLELVNAKTAEAIAKQEVDELRRSLAVQKRRQEEALRLAQAEADTFRAQADALRAEAEQKAAEEAAEAAEIERRRFEAERSQATTPGEGMTEIHLETSIEDEAPDGRKGAAKSAPASAAGWFWNRRSPSTTTAAVPTRAH